MMVVAYRRDVVAACLIVLLTACSGDGSDIGPRLARLPDASSKVQLLDDQNRGRNPTASSDWAQRAR